MPSVHKGRTPAPYKTSTGIPRICIPTLPRYVSTSAFGRTVSLADGRRHWLMPRHRLWVFGLRISVLPRRLRGTISLPIGWPGSRPLCLRSTLTPNRRRRFGSPWQSFAYCIWVSEILFLRRNRDNKYSTSIISRTASSIAPFWHVQIGPTSRWAPGLNNNNKRVVSWGPSCSAAWRPT